MSTQQYKYINLNGFPIHLPDQRGGQVMFRPGEGSTNQWFSRFCGERQLTRLPIDAKKPSTSDIIKNAKISKKQKEESEFVAEQKQIDNPVVDIKEPKLVETPKTIIVPEDKTLQDTAEYTVRNGLFRCRLCDVFMTGSLDSMNNHLTYFHERPVVKLKQEALAVSQPVSPALDQPSQQVGEDKNEEVETTAATAQQQSVTNNKEEQLICAFPGCGKIFRSKRGLNMHQIRLEHHIKEQ